MNGSENMIPPWEKCECAKQVGEMAVYVDPHCRGDMHMICGSLVVSKRECRRCYRDYAKRNYTEV